MNHEFELIRQKIIGARHPEEIFGSLEGVSDPLKAGRAVFRSLSKLTHPDLYPDLSEQLVAKETFARLSLFWQQAQLKIDAGTYGLIESSSEKSGVLKTRKYEYTVEATAFSADYANLYRCSFREGEQVKRGLLKIVRDPLDNDLIENEARILGVLKDSPEFAGYSSYFPKLLETLTNRDPADPAPRRANIFERDEYDYYSINELRQAYPDGVDPKDVAWIWRRVLVGMGFAHNSELIHGSILPTTIFIQPENHGLLIHEWGYAVHDPLDSAEIIAAINSKYESWYPDEVTHKQLPTPSIDIFMGAKNMVYLMGADPDLMNFPRWVPAKFQSFFKSCLLDQPWKRPQNAWTLLKEFDGLLADLWGPRRFHPFGVPKMVSESPFR